MNTDLRNMRMLPCEQCLPNDTVKLDVLDLDAKIEMMERMRKIGTLKEYEKIVALERRFREYVEFFQRKIGSEPTSFQKTWMKRVLSSKSFTVVAPTGVGKTTFGMITALWISKNEGKSLLVFPTIILATQVYERMVKLSDGNERILLYHSKLRKSDREKAMERIVKDEFDILLVSSQFISRSWDAVKTKKFDFIFIDDVDSVLKSSSNIDRIIILTGIPEKIVKERFEMMMKAESKEEPIHTDHGILVVSSATARPKGLKPLLFRELLGFDVGSLVVSVRNISNLIIKSKSHEKLKEILSLLRDGVLIFTPSKGELDELMKVLEDLKKDGIEISSVEKDEENLLRMFKEGKLNILCGVARYYGKLVRGLDMPERAKFALFWGVPCFEYRIDMDGANRFVLRKVLREMAKREREYANLLKLVEKERDIERVRMVVRGKIPDDLWERNVREVFSRYRVDGNFLRIPDVMTYIQASGRTSRFMKCGLTKGVSIIFEEDEKILENLRERMEWLTEDEWDEFDAVNLEKLMMEVDESRKCDDGGEKGEDFKSTLIVVESPTKALTISNFFGRSSSRRLKGLNVHEIMSENRLILLTASRGHVYDLTTNAGIHGVERVNGRFVPVCGTIKRCKVCGHQFTEDTDRCPRCGSNDLDDKTAVLSSLRELAFEVDEILIATDPDTEGERISWDIAQFLKPVNPNVRRIELHEITRAEFKRKVKEPRDFDLPLVEAQIVRRIQDRWVGFELSGKVQRVFNRRDLSAGRVQSTVLGWIVKRKEDYEKSKKIFTIIEMDGRKIEVEGKHEIEKIRISQVEEFEDEILPSPPYTTDTILMDGSRVLKVGVMEVMNMLQDLFEMGFITYHRTDSTRISKFGIEVAKRILDKEGLLNYFDPRSWEIGKKGAHEAIRPTKPFSPDDLEDYMEEELIRGKIGKKLLELYRLIFERFLKSQMKPVKVIKQKAVIEVGNVDVEDTVVKKIVEDGWNRIDPDAFDLYEYRIGEYRIRNLKYIERHTLQLHTQASIISEMKEKGVGRPSTYSKIVEILFKRGYIFEDRYKRIHPTKLGRMVFEYLEKNYPEFVNENKTRELEELMDRVANGEMEYDEAMKSVYDDLRKIRTVKR